MNINPEWEVHPAEVRERQTRGDEFLLLDVRRPAEWNLARITGSTLIPLQELGARAVEITHWREKPVVVLCHHGVRSMHATAFLRKLGFGDVHSMAGGIDAWSMVADPNVPRY